MTTKEIIKSDRPPLDLPKFRTEDWMKYLDSLFTIPSAEMAGAMNMRHPEFIMALALFRDKGGMPTKTIEGIIYGVALMQFLYTQNYLKFWTPPPILGSGIDPEGGLIV